MVVCYVTFWTANSEKAVSVEEKINKSSCGTGMCSYC